MRSLHGGDTGTAHEVLLARRNETARPGKRARLDPPDARDFVMVLFRAARAGIIGIVCARLLVL